MKFDIDYTQAVWYAWGRADEGARLTGPPDAEGGDPAFGFARAWSAVAGDYAAERRAWRPSVRDAFASWQRGDEF